jgi:hypothetical protein
LFVFCFNRSDCFPRECQRVFQLCSVCYGMHLKWHFVASARRRLAVRFQDRGHCRTCTWIPESFYCNKRSFPPCIRTCLSISHRTAVQAITPLIYGLRIFLKTLDATRSVRYLSALQPGTSWSGRNEW